MFVTSVKNLQNIGHVFVTSVKNLQNIGDVFVTSVENLQNFLTGWFKNSKDYY